MINKIFLNLGMTEREAKVYLAILKLCNPNISDLQKQTGLSRSTVYYCIDLLIKNDIVFSKKLNEKTVYEAISPEQLKKIVEYKITELKKDITIFEKAIPDIVQSTKKGKMNLKMLKGFKSLTNTMRDVYIGHKNSTVRVFGTKPKEYNLKHFDKSFEKTINNRITNNVFLKGISPITKNKFLVRDKDLKQLRESRFLPEKTFNFQSEIFIFDDLVLVISEDIENEVNTIYFDDVNYVNTMKMIFDLAWEAAGKYDKEVVAEYEKNISNLSNIKHSKQ